MSCVEFIIVFLWLSAHLYSSRILMSIYSFLHLLVIYHFQVLPSFEITSFISAHFEICLYHFESDCSGFCLILILWICSTGLTLCSFLGNACSFSDEGLRSHFRYDLLNHRSSRNTKINMYFSSFISSFLFYAFV